MKNPNRLLSPALCLGIWLLGTVYGQCFFNCKHNVDEAMRPARTKGRPQVASAPSPGSPCYSHAAQPCPVRLTTIRRSEHGDLPYYGYRYYNPRTGRWLSRDPKGEMGGSSLYSFVGNDPMGHADRLGLDMVLRERFEQYTHAPTEGDYAGWYGLTYFQPFNPTPWVYKVTQCCWKINLAGYANLYSWWVEGTAAPDGTPSRDHEMGHVAIHRNTFYGFVGQASAYAGVCFTEGQANCFKGVITGWMQKAWLASNKTANLMFDCATYGDRCAEIADALLREQDAWNQLDASLKLCMKIDSQ